MAKLELAQKGRRAGVGAGMFGAAGVAGLYAVGALTACVVLALATAVTGWLAALIVAAGLRPRGGRPRAVGQVEGQRRRCPPHPSRPPRV